MVEAGGLTDLDHILRARISELARRGFARKSQAQRGPVIAELVPCACLEAHIAAHFYAA